MKTYTLTAETRYELHQAWRTCTACALYRDRKQVVLGRGVLPCTVLFIGEAPGRSEDSLGEPFVGPAGQLLDKILAEVFAVTGNRRYAITNVVACIPIHHVEGVSVLRVPTPNEAYACQPRLTEFLEMARPRHIVLMGKIAQKLAPPAIDSYRKTKCHRIRKVIRIYHPAYLLRKGGDKALEYRRIVLQLQKDLQ